MPSIVAAAANTFNAAVPAMNMAAVEFLLDNGSASVKMETSHAEQEVHEELL